MRRPCGPSGAWPEQRQRRAHRGRVGVVALVDQQRRTVRKIERGAGAAPGRGCLPRERERGASEIGTGETSGGEHGERVHHQMLARRTDLVGNGNTEDVRFDRRAVGLQRAFEEPRIGTRVLAERDHGGCQTASAWRLSR